MAAVKLRGHRYQAAHESHQRVPVEIGVLDLHEEHPDAGDDQKRAEQIQNPMEPADQRRTDGDHHAAQHDRAEDAPEQHTMLVLRRHAEKRKHRHHHDDVVGAQRLFDDIAGQIFRERHVAVVDEPVDAIDRDAEPEPLLLVRQYTNTPKPRPSEIHAAQRISASRIETACGRR